MKGLRGPARCTAPAAVLTWAALAVLVGCDAGTGLEMISMPTPPGWESTLLAERAAKDRQFRFDPESPLLAEDRTGFEAEYWAPDESYYFVGPVHYHENPEQFTIITTTGKPRPCEKLGWIDFRLDGQQRQLQVYRLLDNEAPDEASSFFLPFTDGTTGEETYPAGRYIDLQGSPGGPFVLDFNAAYNPWCAYGAPERFACPTTPAENRLDIRIEAGERGYKRETGGAPAEVR